MLQPAAEPATDAGRAGTQTQAAFVTSTCGRGGRPGLPNSPTSARTAWCSTASTPEAVLPSSLSHQGDQRRYVHGAAGVWRVAVRALGSGALGRCDHRGGKAAALAGVHEHAASLVDPMKPRRQGNLGRCASAGRSQSPCWPWRSVPFVSRRSRRWPMRLPRSTAIYASGGGAAAADARLRRAIPAVGAAVAKCRRDCRKRCCCTKTAGSAGTRASILSRSRAAPVRPTRAIRARAARPSRCSWRGDSIASTAATSSGKLAQMAAALWLEARYSKDEILEAYLNVAPYGGNVEGRGRGQPRLFRQAARTTLRCRRSLTLAVIPQNPRRRVPAHRPEESRQLPARSPMHVIDCGRPGSSGIPTTRTTRPTCACRCNRARRHDCRFARRISRTRCCASTERGGEVHASIDLRIQTRRRAPSCASTSRTIATSASAMPRRCWSIRATCRSRRWSDRRTISTRASTAR